MHVHLSGVHAVLQASNASLDVLNAIQLDPRSCASSFNIDPVTCQFIVCPSCHCLYPFTSGENVEDTSTCTYMPTPTSQSCRAPLWKERQLEGNLYRSVPICTYLRHDLKMWVGQLLSRPGMEDLLEHPFTPQTQWKPAFSALICDHFYWRIWSVQQKTAKGQYSMI